MKFRTSLLSISALTLAVVFSGCKKDNPDDNDFGNKVYINSVAKTTNLLIKATISSDTRSFNVAIAKPEAQNTSITFKVDSSLVATYNMAYYDNAILLPKDFYKIPELTAQIPAGAVRSTDIVVNFVGINALDRDIIYVLPLTIVNSGSVAVLQSARTMYCVFKAGALVNVVADIEEKYLKNVKTSAPELIGLSKFTIEALVRAHSFTRSGSDSEIMSLMGVEGHCLIRTGDANHPGQLQVAFSGKNYPGKDANKILPLNKWVHVAVTYDAAGRNLRIYVDGKLQSEETTNAHGNINLFNNFFIGKSWNVNRWWAGDICETRIWNLVRTQEEIAANFYYVDPASTGLVAYWKFDDNLGGRVKDHTSYGNHMDSYDSSNERNEKTDLRWLPVSLPPAK